MPASCGSLLGHLAVAVVATTVVTAALTYQLAVLLRATIGLRVTSAEDTAGLGAAHDTPLPIPFVPQRDLDLGPSPISTHQDEQNAPPFLREGVR